MKKIFIAVLLFASVTTYAQMDVQHYRFKLHLHDTTDLISGEATISIKFRKPVTSFSLDLVSDKVKQGKGMQVHKLKGMDVITTRIDQKKMYVLLDRAADTSMVYTFTVEYSGIPADGLIISKNKYGERTFFADNWPNRASHWLPVNDRPDDKASFEFLITAPLHYKVVSNGVLVEESVNGKEKFTHWKESTPLSTKIMVIGAADFAVRNYVDSNTTVPVSAWVYTKDSSNGFYDYALAVPILNFFEDYIGPYPYKKLANVQSKTIFGGMENAGAIFYSEESVSGKRESEDLLAHEIVHQWFGDMASEKSFAHLWLSEGFASYLTDIYIEKKYGIEAARKRLVDERKQVIAFQKNKRPVVDTTSNLMSLLNANSYQKGAWVLHMIRMQTGDAQFQTIIREYYNAYKGSNADTRDFQQVVEKVTGRSWKTFFDTWLYQPLIPVISGTYKFTSRGLEVDLKRENNPGLPLEITIGATVNGSKKTHSIAFKENETVVRHIIPMQQKPSSVQIDPDVHLLFDGKLTAK